MVGKKKTRRIMRKNPKRAPRAPDPSSTKYSGVVSTRTAEQGIVAILRGSATYATGVGTSFNSYTDNNPSAADNWAEYAGAWSEYRVLGMKLTYAPNFVVNTATVGSGINVHSVLHAPTVASATTTQQAYSQGDARVGSITKPFTRTWKMSSATESAWIPTGTPAANSLAFSHSSFGLTTGLTYGIGFITYMIQFRTSSV